MIKLAEDICVKPYRLMRGDTKMIATKIIREQAEADRKRYHDENSSFPKEWYFDKFNKILEIVLDDVPHQYQDRLLEILVDKD